MGIQSSEIKQPREIIRKGFDFTGNKKLAAGDTLDENACQIIITDPDGLDVTSTMLVSNSLTVVVLTNIVSGLIQAGTSGLEYKVTFLAGTTQGELLEEDLILPVENL